MPNKDGSTNPRGWGKFKCPICGKFVKDVRATLGYDAEGYIGGEYIDRVEGVCKTHGLVNVKDNNEWDWDTFNFEEVGVKV